MIFNKEKRIKYLGFDDFWFVGIGIFVLSFLIDYVFKNSFANSPFGTAMISWGISLIFSVVNWIIMRAILISLRKRYPDFQDNIKRITLVFLLLIVTILVVDLIGRVVLHHLFGDSFNPLERLRGLTFILVISTMITAIYEVIYLYVRLKKTIREEEQAKQVVVQAELDALRNQAQPHFLFNSLNTLRDIIDQNPKEDAKEFVNKLSNVYRFILESGNAHLTPLRSELKFAQSYIHIQSERFGDNLKVNWAIPDAYLNKMVVPMSLQLLLENAIKHNVISKAKPLLINVEVMDNHLVINNKIQPKSTQLPSTKVGLKNIEKRYELISGKAIQLSNNGEQFEVSLPLLKPTDQKHQYANSDH